MKVTIQECEQKKYTPDYPYLARGKRSGQLYIISRVAATGLDGGRCSYILKDDKYGECDFEPLSLGEKVILENT